MIYGQDQAVRYPVKDLYDTGMMNLYITAIKDEYERGIKEQEEFISKYGDFISPFQKDVENWDRLTMDPIIEAYDYLQKNGIDPLRSQEGRALLADIRRKVPREKLSMLRQSAAAGQEYLSNRAKLQAAGQYNPEFEQFLLGDRTFEGQDTLSQGMWDRTAPTEFKGLRTLTDPWFKNRTAKYKGTKGGYDYYGYDVNDMKTATNDQIQAFLSNDYGRYYYDQALKVAQASRQPGESDESVRKRAQEILVNDIVDVNRDYLLEDRKANQFALEEMAFRNKVRLASMQRRWAKEDAEQQRATIPSWTDTLIDSTNKNKGERDYNRLRDVLVEIYKHNTAIANNSKLSKSTRNKAKKQADWYKLAIDNYDKGTAWVTKDNMGHIKPTEAGYKILNNYDAKMRKPGIVGAGYDRLENEYLNRNVMLISDGMSRDYAYRFVAGDNTRALPGMTSSGEKYRYMTFGGNNNLRRARVGNITGAGFTSGSISKRFNDYLRKNKVTGYIIDNQISVGRTPRKAGQGANMDFYYDVYVPDHIIDAFAEQIGKSADEVRKSLGAVHQQMGVKKDEYGTETAYKMTRVPVTTTSTDSSLRAWEDANIDKSNFGASNAYNLFLDRVVGAIDNSNQ